MLCVPFQIYQKLQKLFKIVEKEIELFVNIYQVEKKGKPVKVEEGKEKEKPKSIEDVN